MKLDFNEILLLVKSKKIQQALNQLDILIEEDGNNFNYYHLKGTLHFNLEELSDAIKCFSSALAIKNNDINMYYLRGASYVKQQNYQKGKQDFEKAITLKKNFSEAYFGLGILYYESYQNLLAIENFLKSIKFKNNFSQPALHLIKILTQTKNIKSEDSIIISKHNEINMINFNYSSNEYIEDKRIKNFLINLDNIINNTFENLNFKSTQIYRKNQNLLNCKRHKKIFNKHNIIPKFCFGCYKVQIEPENLIDLIKLYFIFDNIELEKNNIRKCMIEVRPNVKGNYKGLIYCDSIEEARFIQKKICLIIEKNLNKEVACKVKRGCTEYGIKYPKYNNLENDTMNYEESWKNYENLIDKKFAHLSQNKEDLPTIKGVTLNDVLIIKNWIAHAKKISDYSLDSIS